MSRIGRLPVAIPGGVDVSIAGREITVKGPKGELTHTLVMPIGAEKNDDAIVITRPDDERDSRARHGLSRSLVNNMVVGVTQGFEKQLEIVGVGYRVTAKGSSLDFSLGFSHPVVIDPPEGITFRVDSPTKFTVAGIDKQKVGQIAANIRRLRKSDPYKGKGIRYEGEQVRRKVGKTGK